MSNFVITSVQMSTSHRATIITDFLTWKLSNVARCLEWISFTSLTGKFQNKFQPLMKITLREQPFNLKGGGGGFMFFFLKKIF
jgi:hypothetical protein